MASAVDIVNLALAHIGDSATVASINPPEATPQAAHAARFYPIALQECLEAHSWNFATKRATLALLSQTPPDNWQFTYALPSGYIKALRVLSPTTAGLDFSQPDLNDVRPQSLGDNDGQDFIIEALANGTAVLYTNAEDAILVYIANVTDTTKFTPRFVTALSYLLASYLAGPITRDIKLKTSLLQIADNLLGRAEASDANTRQSNPYKDFVPSSVAARR